MRKEILIVGILLISFNNLNSCMSTKESQKIEDSKATVNESEMKAKGFISGIVIYSTKKGDCEYSIKIDEEVIYDPLNLSEEFKNHEQKVWFTFTGLRRANRCKNKSPIRISEMIKG